MRVLIGYDGSEFADAALDDLQRAALPHDVEAVVLSAADVVVAPANHVDPVGISVKVAEELRRFRVRANEALAEARGLAERGATRLRGGFPHWRVTAEGIADSPGWALVKRSEGADDQSWRTDLIVIGAAGRSMIGQVVFGSVAHQVLTHATCSKRIGRARRRSAGASSVRLVVAVDGSAGSDAAVHAVVARAWPAGTECRVVTVVDSRMTTTLPPHLPTVLLAPEPLAQHVANQRAEQLRAAGLSAAAVVKEGGAARHIVQEAEEFGADCIFIGARGLTRAERFLLGSVSISVAMRADCSVEIVHPA